MKYLLRKILLILTIVLCTTPILADELTLYSPTYFNEQNNELEEISYLNNELLSFEICSKNAQNIKAKYTCENNQGELEIFKHTSKNSCSYHNSNFSQIPCNDFTLEVTFNQDNRERVITREFSKKKESIVLEKVLQQDPLELDPLDMSYYLVLHSLTKGIDNKMSNDIYDSLKQTRDNTNKCWPKNNCDSLTTSKILYNIKLAGYSKDSRLLDDGQIYLQTLFLEDSQIEYPTSSNNQQYDIDIEVYDEFSQDNNCEITIDNEDIQETYSFDDNSKLEDLHIIETLDEDLSFSCEENIESLSYILSEEIIYNNEEENEDILSYSIPSSDLEDYNLFTTKIQFEHDFGNDEISCDITIDDETTQYTFNNQSSKEDLTIKETIEEEFEIDCDDNIDYARTTIYAGQKIEEDFSNENSFSLEIKDLFDNTFDTYITFDYNFDKETLTCEIEVDNNNPQTIEFEEDDNLIIDSYSAKSSVEFSCDDTLENIESYVIDKFDRKQVKNEAESTNSISFSIPNDFSQYSCIGEDKTCNQDATLYTLMTYESFENKNELTTYINSLLEKDGDFPLLQTENAYEDAGKFLVFNSNSQLVESLKFLQNNDGSWGNGNNEELLKGTLWSKMGLLEREKSSEHIKDATNWIYEEEPILGWNTLELNALAYLGIKEQVKPYITIESFNNIEEKTNITLRNPTIFNLENLKVSFTGGLRNSILFKENLGQLNSNEELKLTLTPRPNLKEKVSGTIQISGIHNEKTMQLLEIPFSVEQNRLFNIEDSEIFYTQGEPEISIPITHNTNQEYFFTCSFSSQLSSANQEVLIDESTKSFKVNNQNAITGSTPIILDCSSANQTTTISKNIKITEIEKTFEVKDQEIIIDSKSDKAVSLQNTLDSRQLVSFQLSDNLIPFLSLPESNKMFAVNETREMFLVVNSTKFDNLNSSVVGELTIKGNQYSTTIPLEITKSPQETQGVNWILWTIIILALGFIVLVIIRYRKLQEDEENDSTYEDGEEDFDEIIFE